MSYRISCSLIAAAAVVASGCVVHVADEPAGADASSARASLSGERESREAPPTRADAASLVRVSEGGACALPEGFAPSKASLAFPTVVAGEGMEVAAAVADVKMGPDGLVLFRFDLELKNKGTSPAKARIGYLWRERMVGAAPTTIDVRFENAEALECVVESSPQMHQPYRDRARWIEVEVPAGDSVHAGGAYKLPVAPADKPESLFGRPDSFSHNWKNWDWPYIHAPEYAAIAASMTSYFAEIGTIEAARLQVTLSGSTGAPWLRAMSHEQACEKMRQSGTFRWTFEDGGIPRALGFEYLPGLDAADEIAAFEKITASRPTDLRARIRLSELHRFAGDAARRAAVLEEALSVWDANAKAQLLTGRNDPRGPLYVALVSALLSMGKNDAAKKRAREGAKTVAGLEDGLHENRLAAAWLEAAAR